MPFSASDDPSLVTGIERFFHSTPRIALRHQPTVLAQADLSGIRGRYALVRARTGLICAAKRLTNSFGERIRGRNAKAIRPEVGETPLNALETITEGIRDCNQR